VGLVVLVDHRRLVVLVGLWVLLVLVGLVRHLCLVLLEVRVVLWVLHLLVLLVGLVGVARRRLGHRGLLEVHRVLALLGVLEDLWGLVCLVEHLDRDVLVNRHLRGHLVILVGREVRVGQLGMACMEVVLRVHMVAAVVFLVIQAYQVHLVYRDVLACRSRQRDQVDLADNSLSIVCRVLD